MLRIGMVALLAILLAGLFAGASSAQAQAPPAPAAGQQPVVYGAPPAQTPAQTPVRGGPQHGRGWRKWWKRAKCAAAITLVFASSVFAATKIAKIRGAVRALGGIKNTAKLLVGATTRREKMRKLLQAGAGAAAYFMGIDTIKEAC